MRLLLLFLSLAVLETGVLSQCSIGELRKCITGFIDLVTPKKDFKLTSDAITKICETANTATGCLTKQAENCTEENKKAIAESGKFITNSVCISTSDFFKAVTDQCIFNASANFTTCAAEETGPFPDERSKSCCEYVQLKGCAKEISKSCNDNVYKQFEKFVVNVTGLGYEWDCKPNSYKCTSSADVSQSTMWILILSAFFSITFFL